ncbi:MAG: hypothetical protein AB2761_21805 [Candidatus Thiodiazotropha endolucinida]
MRGESLSIIFSLDAISAVDVWDILFQELTRRGISKKTLVDLFGKKLALDKLHKGIKNANRGHFGIEIDRLSIDYAPVANYEHALLKIKDVTESVNYGWDQWTDTMILNTGFIQAWVVNNEYNYWQNAHDPIQYKAKGRSYAGLPMKSNNLPPPLKQMIIDTSNNPGRRIIRMGYVEAIGSPMWLGRQFWERTDAYKIEVMESFPNHSKLIGDDILRIQVLDKPFTEDSDVTLQNRLREVLYPGVEKL